MFDTFSAQIGAAFVILICGFAFVKGDEPERVWGGAYILGWFASLLVQQDVELYKINVRLLVIDLAMLIVLIGLVWKSRKVWPTWAAACQLLIVMSHIIALTNLDSSMLSVITVINLAGYGVLVTLAIGTFWAWQERRAAGLE